MKTLLIILVLLFSLSSFARSIICHTGVCSEISPGDMCPHSIFINDKSQKVQFNYQNSNPSKSDVLADLSIELKRRKSIKLSIGTDLLLDAQYNKEYGMYVGDLEMPASDLATEIFPVKTKAYCQGIN